MIPLHVIVERQDGARLWFAAKSYADSRAWSNAARDLKAEARRRHPGAAVTCQTFAPVNAQPDPTVDPAAWGMRVDGDGRTRRMR